MEVQSSLVMDLSWSLDIRESSFFVLFYFFGHFFNSLEIKNAGYKLSRKFQVMFYLMESRQKEGNWKYILRCVNLILLLQNKATKKIVLSTGGT